MARDGGMTLAEADPVLAYLTEFRASFDAFRALVEKRLDKIEDRLDRIETRLAGHDSRFDTIEARISLLGVQVNRKLDELRTELVNHMERLHLEIDGRVADPAGPARGSSGGSALTN